MKCNSIFILVLLFILPLIRSETIDEIKARYLYGSTTVDTYTIPYRYFVPQDYSPNNKYAIITFLHGGGENGNDNQLQLLRAPIILANDTTQSMYKFFIVAPQCPTGVSWEASYMWTAVMQAQSEVIAKYPGIDGTGSRFLMGLSTGSVGTWEHVNHFPGIYQKAIPVAGGDTNINPVNFRDTKIWTFASSNDALAWDSTVNTVNLLRDDGQTVKFDDPNAGHPVDELILRNYPVIDWLFGDTGTGLPSTPQAPQAQPPQSDTNPPVAIEPPVAEPPVASPSGNNAPVAGNPPVAAPSGDTSPVAVNPPVSEQPQAPVSIDTPIQPPVSHRAPAADGIVNNGSTLMVSLALMIVLVLIHL